MMYMGEDGYMECARRIMESARTIADAVRNTDGVEVMGNPLLSVVAFTVSDPCLACYLCAFVHVLRVSHRRTTRLLASSSTSTTLGQRPPRLADLVCSSVPP